MISIGEPVVCLGNEKKCSFYLSPTPMIHFLSRVSALSVIII